MIRLALTVAAAVVVADSAWHHWRLGGKVKVWLG